MSAYRKMGLVPMPKPKTPAAVSLEQALEAMRNNRAAVLLRDLEDATRRIAAKSTMGLFEATVMAHGDDYEAELVVQALRGQGYRAHRPWWDHGSPHYIEVSWRPPRVKRWWQFWRRT